MKIVEYAIKIRDMGSAQLASFGRKVSEQNNKTREYASKVQQLNKFYGSSPVINMCSLIYSFTFSTREQGLKYLFPTYVTI